MNGSLTQLHKPLGSAGEFSKQFDSVLTDCGGWLLPRMGPIATGMGRELERLRWPLGEDGCVSLHKEHNVYNFYVKKNGPIQQVEQCAVGDEIEAQAHSGGRRQAAP